MKRVEWLWDGASNLALLQVAGPLESHLKTLEKLLKAKLYRHNNHFAAEGEQAATAMAVIQHLARISHMELSLLHVEQALRQVAAAEIEHQERVVVGRQVVSAQSQQQAHYLRLLKRNSIVLALGPAGSGKTFLAVARALEALDNGEVERLVLTRPAVEAGEKLGFLPGDMAQKLDPYLKPLYDALHELAGPERIARLMERQLIELAPLAFMRGRTLSRSFVILDEAQNTTISQMKMFLTRLGFGSAMVAVGDPSQVDLPSGQPSGLSHAAGVLAEIEGVGVAHLSAQDVVRHRLVGAVIRAYERAESEEGTPLATSLPDKKPKKRSE